MSNKMPLPPEYDNIEPLENNFVLDMDFRQVLPGDFVMMPCFNSIVDRGMVLSVQGSLVEFMILSPETGIPETIVLDMQRPDPTTGVFGRYGYVGIKVVARKGEPTAQDFGKQLVNACHELDFQNRHFNPYMMVQAQARTEFIENFLGR